MNVYVLELSCNGTITCDSVYSSWELAEKYGKELCDGRPDCCFEIVVTRVIES